MRTLDAVFVVLLVFTAATILRVQSGLHSEIDDLRTQVSAIQAAMPTATSVKCWTMTPTP